MTALVEDDEKTERPKIFYACVESAQKDVPLADTRRKERERLVLRELTVGRTR